jgi:ATP-dependent 26S proteasome regulatory subunit
MAPVQRDDIVLPAKTLALLERNVFGFSRHRKRLRELGLPAKKGLLFYGPPGTGKTHTIRYLAGSLPGHTTLLVTAEQVGLLPEYMKLARLLSPSIVVIEDADLIARQREDMNSACEEVLLNRLLNEMDGLKENSEILFVLTTNRPEALEVAL